MNQSVEYRAISLFAFLFLVTGCANDVPVIQENASSTSVQERKVYMNETQTFEMTYASDWTVEDDPIPNVDAVIIYSPGHSEEAMEIDVPAMRIQMPAADRNWQGESTLIDGKHALDSGWVADESGGAADGYRSIFIENPTIGIVMFGDKTFHPIFEDMLQSITLKD